MNRWERLAADTLAGFKDAQQRKVAEEVIWAEIEKRTGGNDDSEFAMSRRFRMLALGLESLGHSGHKADAEFGRRFIHHDSEEVRVEAIRLLASQGNEDDCETLWKEALSSEPSIQKEAASALLHLSASAEQTLTRLLESEQRVLISTALDFMRNHREHLNGSLVEPLLNVKDGEARLEAIKFFEETLTKDELEALLDRYLERSGYYYDVVCTLDRLLWLPGVLQSP